MEWNTKLPLGILSIQSMHTVMWDGTVGLTHALQSLACNHI